MTDPASRWSVHVPIKGMRLALGEMERGVQALLDGDRRSAEGHLAAANRPDVRDHFALVAGPVRDGRPKKRPATHSGLVLMPSVSVRREIYKRDRWHCRFCQIPVVDPEATKRITSLAPGAFFVGRRNVETHSVVLALRATPDHVLPRCYGGTNELDNLATACGCCQFGRGDWTLEDVRVSYPRPPVKSDWDGLRRVLNLRPVAAKGA